MYREWLPGAKEVYLIGFKLSLINLMLILLFFCEGDFNDWNRS